MKPPSPLRSRPSASPPLARPAPGHRRLALLLLTLTLLPAAAKAQPYRYGLSGEGRLVIDTTVLDKLPGSFDAGDFSNALDQWIDVVVLGPDRWTLRRDGLLWRDGQKLAKLADPFTWEDLAVDGDGAAWTLRRDGLLAKDGASVVQLPNDGVSFLGFTVADGSVWTLRGDGAIFRDSEITPVDTLVGPDPVAPIDYFWGEIAVDPVSGEVYGLRRDGVLVRTGDDPGGVLVATLPAPPTGFEVSSGAVYWDLDFLSDGTWVVLRGDGAVFSADATVTPLVDFPGEPLADGTSELFLDLTLKDDAIWTIRWDGRVYSDADPGQKVFDYTKSGYLAIALSDDPPDLSNIKNGKPAMAKYKAFATEGETVVMPIVVTDTDKTADELVITPVGELPPGVTYDDDARTLTFAGTLPPGNVKVKLQVDDGVIKKPRKFKQSLKIKPADDDPSKNKKPRPAKIKGAEPLVGVPFSLVLLATDEDGDGLTITPVAGKGVFALPDSDASFDAETATFSWTPTVDDVGKQIARFLVDDGVAKKPKKVKLKLKVRNALLFPGDG